LIVPLSGGLVWVAAVVFAVAVTLLMLIRTRARVSKKIITGNEPERGIGIPATANRGVPSAPVESVAAEEPGRNERVLGEPGAEEARDDRLNALRISVEETPERQVLVVPSVENVSVSDDHDVDVLVPVAEEAPAVAPTKPDQSRPDIACT
jgi:hypothetical protein